MIPKCPYCGKPYKKNPHILEGLPAFIKEKITYIADCDCFDKIQEKELEELEKKRVRECQLNRIKKFRDISLTDNKFYNSKFENCEKNKLIIASYKYAKKFLEKIPPIGILFSGVPGVGKTFASSCMANYLMEHNKTVMVMSLGLYLNKIFREWAEAENEVLGYVKECDLLIIDDLGTEKASEFAIEKTFMLIDTRYRSQKPLVVTSNLTLQLIKQKFGSRIADRLAEMCYTINSTGESYRGKDTREKFTQFMEG